MIQKGEFREDLYYRIRVIPIELPTLVERRKDIPLLVNHFANLLATKAGNKTPSITSTAMRALYDYDYPGNVRELRNIIERAFVLCTNNAIDVEDLPREVTTPSHRQTHDVNPLGSEMKDRGMLPVDEANQSSEIQAIVSALNVHGWNRAAAADALDMGRTTLWRKMKKYGII
jgi:two-component system response regulator AtoC